MPHLVFFHSQNQSFFFSIDPLQFAFQVATRSTVTKKCQISHTDLGVCVQWKMSALQGGLGTQGSKEKHKSTDLNRAEQNNNVQSI